METLPLGTNGLLHCTGIVRAGTVLASEASMVLDIARTPAPMRDSVRHYSIVELAISPPTEVL